MPVTGVQMAAPTGGKVQHSNQVTKLTPGAKHPVPNPAIQQQHMISSSFNVLEHIRFTSFVLSIASDHILFVTGQQLSADCLVYIKINPFLRV